MLCDLPFELLCLIVEKIDLNSTITLSQTCKYLRAAVLATPRAITINVQFGKEEETDEEPPPFENISFFVKELHCIKCLHVFQANGQLLKQVCACFCHRMDEKLPSITTMNVELCNEDSACLSNFSPILSSVRKIHLIEAIVSDSDVFEKMTNLEELLITCPEQLTTATLLSICAKLPKLQKLAIVGAIGLSDDVWDVVDLLPELTHLFLRGTGMTGTTKFPSFDEKSQLQLLDISNSLITDNFFKHLELPPSLEYLGLEDTRVTNRCLEFVQFSEASKSLKTLSMRGNQFDTEEQNPYLRNSHSRLRLERFPKLKVLDLANTGLALSKVEGIFKDDGIQFDLENFSLSHPNRSDGGVRLVFDDETHQSFVENIIQRFQQFEFENVNE